MKSFKVFNVEFDGIDKSGKDTIMKQIFSAAPNLYIPKSRGLISQIAYSHIYNRDFEYKVTKGYLENTLFVLLDVEEEDWKIRCDISGEHLNNRYRSDMEGDVEFVSNTEGFNFAYDYLKSLGANIIRFNTSVLTPYQIIKNVIAILDNLNKEE